MLCRKMFHRVAVIGVSSLVEIIMYTDITTSTSSFSGKQYFRALCTLCSDSFFGNAKLACMTLLIGNQCVVAAGAGIDKGIDKLRRI